MRAVEDEAGGALADATLKKSRGSEPLRGRLEHREQRPDRNIGVDVVGAVQRIDRHQQRPCVVQRDGLVALLGDDSAHARAFQAVDERLVGENIERLLGDPVVTGPDRGVESARKAAPADEIGDRKRRAGDRAQDAGQSGGAIAPRRRRGRGRSLASWSRVSLPFPAAGTRGGAPQR